MRQYLSSNENILASTTTARLPKKKSTYTLEINKIDKKYTIDNSNRYNELHTRYLYV